ncbi:MAG: DUF1501 domain-containing protein [Zavarzinella sp.]
MNFSSEMLRRHFLTTGASGIGSLALAHMLQQDGYSKEPFVGGTLGKPHFAPKAKNCICIFMGGAPSQIDLFDPKPELNRLHGKPLPEEMTKNVRFAFIQKATAVLYGSPRKFTPHGQSGMVFSDLLPNIATCADDITMIRSLHTDQFNHHPGQLMMNTGSGQFGRPSMGSWLNYGLGSECQNLPGYVVLTAGRGTSGGTSNWGSGFLPSSYAGVLFRNQGDPVLNLANPPGLTGDLQKLSIDALNDLNQMRFQQQADPEIQSRIAAYELAFRMQQSAPELLDLSNESKKTIDAYGLDRKEPDIKASRGGGKGQYRSFAMNCLLARRMVERGVRFVNIVHASWDHHSNLDNELRHNCQMADQPIAALLKDLKARGLLDETLVLWLAEFGRTPLGENRGGSKNISGRDHHPFAFTVWMAGGGVKGGLTYGKTDDFGWNVVENKMHVNDLHATILHLFGINHEKLTYRFQGRDFRLTDVAGKVIQPLLA